jgi:exonuclease SbcC
MKGDEVINNTVGKNCKTWVRFEIDSDKYLITRYRKYTKYNDTVILNKNGVDIKKGQKEVTPEIDSLICSKRSFMNTLMFGQKVKDFFTDLVDSDKKQIFRELLALEQYQSYYKEADDRLKQTKSDLEKFVMNIGIQMGLLDDAKIQIETLTAAKNKFENDKQLLIAEYRKSIDSNTRLFNEWKKKLDKLEETNVDIEDINEKINQVSVQLESIESSINSEIEMIDQMQVTKKLELEKKANAAENKVKDATAVGTKKIRDDISIIVDKLNTLVSTAQQKRHDLELKISKLENDIINWEDRAKEIQDNVLTPDFSECPLCHQEVSDETISALSAKVDEYNNNILEAKKLTEQYQTEAKIIFKKMNDDTKILNADKEVLQNDLAQLNNEQESKLLSIKERLLAANAKVLKLAEMEKNQKRADLKTKTAELEQQKLQLLQAKKDQQEIIDEINKVTRTMNEIENQIQQRELQIKEKEESTYDETQLNSYLKKVRDIEIKISEINKNSEALESRAKMLEFWKTAFSSAGVPSMLIDEAIPFMNEKVAKYLEMMTNGRYIVSFDTLAATKAGEFRDKISVNVVDTYTRANTRVQLSGGQTRLIDIATILTLGDLQASIQDVSINILLFDEIFDSLDEENIGYVSKVLSKLKFGKAIYLISHRHEGQLEADETLALH